MTVYTSFHAAQGATHTIPFAVDFATRGDRADGETCATARHAGPAYEIIRLNSRGQVTREGGQFASLACGTPFDKT